MQFDHLNFTKDDGLMSIEDLKAFVYEKRKLKVIRKLESISWI